MSAKKLDKERKGMTQHPSRKRKAGGGRKPNPIPTTAIRLPVPLVQKLNFLKKTKGLEFLYRRDIGEIFSGKISEALHFPLFEYRIQAGFPSPTDDSSDGDLDLNEYLTPHKASTFFVRVTGDSMIGIGIFPGDMLIVDRALTPTYGKVVIAVLNGEMTVKRLEKHKDRIFLCSENDKYPDIKISEEDAFFIWGVVTNSIRSLS